MKRLRRNKRSRRRNKLKLRVMGVLALIAAILISLIPMPSMAEDVYDISWVNTSVTQKYDDKDPKELEIQAFRIATDKKDVVLPGYLSLGAVQYKVVLRGPGVFRNCSTIEKLDLSNLVDMNGLTDLSAMFRNCSNLKEVVFPDSFTAENVQSLIQMFDGCTSLQNPGIEKFAPKNATTFSGMFAGCSSLESLDLAAFETDAATEMSEMFAGCTSLGNLDLSKFKTAKVTSMVEMFRDCAAMTSLDLQGFDMTSVSNASDMLKGTQAKTIKTPTAVKSSVKIGLPETYINKDDTDKPYDFLPYGTDSTESITLTGPDHVTDVALTPTEKELTVGGTLTLTATVTPNTATDTTVTWESEDPAKVEVTSTEVTAAGESTALITAKALTEEDAPVKITVTTNDRGKQATCEITVIPGTIDVKSVTLPFDEKNVLVGKAYQLTPTVLPEDATDKTVEWFSDNAGVISVDANGLITAHKKGTARIKAVAKGTSIFDECIITAVESYTVKLNDERTDTSNGTLSKMELDREPESDFSLSVSSVEGMKLQTLLDQREGYNVKDACFFKVSKVTDENGKEVNDYGTITLTLAMPGRLMNKGLTPRLYRYSTVEDALVSVQSTMAELGNEYKIEAFRFDVKDATDDAQYAVVLETKTGYSMYVNDERSVNPQDASAAVTNMHSDLYFFVQDKQKPEIKVLIDQNQNLSSYKTREYYEMFITSDSAGKNNVDDFGICYITMTLPKEMDYTKGDIKVVSMVQNGNQVSLDTSFAPEFKTDAKGVQYITIRATHFSEYALLYLEDQTQPGAGTSATTGQTTGTGASTGTSGQTTGTGTGASGQTTGTGAGTSGQTTRTGTGASGQTTGTGTSGQGTGASGANTNSTSAGVTPTTQTNKNAADMPTTGGSGNLPLYRNMGVIMLALAGATMLIMSKVI